MHAAPARQRENPSFGGKSISDGDLTGRQQTAEFGRSFPSQLWLVFPINYKVSYNTKKMQPIRLFY